MEKKLEALLKSTIELNVQMEKQLIEFVKEHGNLIRTDKTEHKDAIYGFIFDEGINNYIDKKVLAISVFGNQLCVLLGEIYEELDEEPTEPTEEDILDGDGWQPVTAGMMIENATFVSICESISQYV